MISFLHPWLLLLALPAGGLIVFLALKSRSGLDPYRNWLTTGIRLAAVLALVLALAGVRFVKEQDELGVAFLLDASQSVPSADRQKALDAIAEACKGMKEKDRAAVIPFAAEPVMETSFQRSLNVPSSLGSILKTDQTDLASALRLASAAFPPGTMRRVVLISDGNENAGSAAPEADQLRALGITLDVLPLEYAYPNEVMIESLLVPAEVNREEAMEARIVVKSERDSDAVLALYQNGALVARQPVRLQAGKNVLSVPRRLSGDPAQPNRAGFYAFKAFIETPGDRVSENNQAHAFTVVRGEAKVLLVETGEHEDRWLLNALTEEGFAVDRCTPDHLPGGMAEIQAYDALILSNIAVDQLPKDVVEGVPSAVRDLGMGLIMLGGDQSFGAGGWHETGIEEVLPVSMDLTQRKVVPNGALAIILHTMEIQPAADWAKAVALGALEPLSPQDWFGELQMGMNGEEWGIPIQKVADKGALKNKVKGLNNQDMHDYTRVFKMAHDGLKPLRAAVKHCVFISDGDPGPPTEALLKAMVADKITVSTVCPSNIHGGEGAACLKWIAEKGGGRYYNVTDPKHLPKIFAKEAQVIRRALLCQDTFLPKLRRQTDLLRGVERGLPPLHGYVCTTPKERAELAVVSHQGDPILAHWRIGLGKAVAFTSDAKNAWGKDWVAWGDYRRFWAQVMRWTLRTAPKSNFQAQTEIREGKGRVFIDALDAQGRTVNGLSIEGRVSDPSRKGQALEFAQTGPGRYEAAFEAQEAGSYFVSFGYRGEQGEQGVMTTGAAVSYSPEFKDLKTNRALLTRLAETGKGKVLTSLEGVFGHDLPKPKSSTPLWPGMMQIAAWAFFADIVIRRVLIGRREMKAGAKRVLALLPAVGARFRTKPPTREETLASLLRKKEEIQRESFEATPEALAAGEELKTEEAKPKDKPKGTPLPPTPTLGQKPEAPKSYTERLLEAKKKAMEEERRKREGG